MEEAASAIDTVVRVEFSNGAVETSLMDEANIGADTSRVTSVARKTRRSQADRSAATRAKVIAAARDVLCAQGYSGATMHAIRDAAGMSLGAIQHQFPTKAKLMAAVAAEFSAYRIGVYREAIRRGRSPRQSMENLIDANFEMISRPEMAAVLEIHLARRNDPDLDREVGPSTRRFDRRVRLWAYSILHAAGISEDERHLSVQLLNNAVTRGLTVEYIRNPDAAFVARAVRIWKQQMLDLIFGTGG
ncbi:TetR/AcrR family transcriptional regulator [Rhizorhabdus dicambivorans]|nr:TetR/AcrR family transcriptional regulator [Rhizorhabdus dicambivorans]